MANIGLRPEDCEYIFVEYHDVIKNFKPYVLEKLCEKEYRENYTDYIKYEMIENKSISELHGVVQAATTLNILKFVASKPFDFDLTYLDLCTQIDDLYNIAKPIVMTNAIKILLLQKFTKAIYIHSPVYDEDNEKDIRSIYADERVKYVYGDFKTCISNIKEHITSYILADILLVNELIEMKKIHYSSILVANYGYNYKLTEDGKLSILIDDIEEKIKDMVFKLAMFMPFKNVKF